MMDAARSSTVNSPGEGELIPDEMILFHEWTADGVAFELWVYEREGFVLADPQRRFEVGGVVAIGDDQMDINWRGAIADRPQPWLNAQLLRCNRAYFGGGE
jgi:hypothetical protein